ncbi:DUF4407 domain-containing protein [Micrococcales bacterium 31B]|nr:DUF4407 domain-containing protein [Micrococcales bacterium 31B]
MSPDVTPHDPRDPRESADPTLPDLDRTDPLGVAPVSGAEALPRTERIEMLPLDPTETLPAATLDPTETLPAATLDPTETLPAARTASASHAPLPPAAPVEHPTDVLPSLGGYQERPRPYVAPQSWPGDQSWEPQPQPSDTHATDVLHEPARDPRTDAEFFAAAEPPSPRLDTTSSSAGHPTTVLPSLPTDATERVEWQPAPPDIHDAANHTAPEPAPPRAPLPEAPGYSARRHRLSETAQDEYQRLEFGSDLTDADRRFLYEGGDPAGGYRRHRFYEFMGMRPEFLARYPQERAAVMGRFSLVFVTVICSFFGMYYTMYLAFNNSTTSNAGVLALAIAFVFAAIIFVIDLSIIRDFSIPKGLRRDFASTDFKGSGFGRNLFRVLISICIAVIVSHSLVIFFFRADIQANLAEYNQTNSESYIANLASTDPQLQQDLKQLSDNVAAAQTAYNLALATRDAQQICLTNERQGLSNSDVAPEMRCTIGTTSGVAGRAGAAVEREQALAEANTALATASTTLEAAKTAQTQGTTTATAAAQQRAQATYAAGGKRESLIDQSKAFIRVANENKAEVYPIAIAMALALMAIDLLPLVAKYTLKTPMHNTHLTNLLLRSVSGSEAVRRSRQHRNLEDVEYDNTVYTSLAREEALRVAELERIRNRQMVTRFAHASHALSGDQLAALDVSNVDRVARSTPSFEPLPEQLRTSAPELRGEYVQHYNANPRGGGQPRLPGVKAQREILWESLDGHEQVVGTTRADLNNGFVSQFDPGNPEAGSQGGEPARRADAASDPDATANYSHPLFHGKHSGDLPEVNRGH